MNTEPYFHIPFNTRVVEVFLVNFHCWTIDKNEDKGRNWRNCRNVKNDGNSRFDKNDGNCTSDKNDTKNLQE